MARVRAVSGHTDSTLNVYKYQAVVAPVQVKDRRFNEKNNEAKD